jgi:hypothetical protein
MALTARIIKKKNCTRIKPKSHPDFFVDHCPLCKHMDLDKKLIFVTIRKVTMLSNLSPFLIFPKS